MKKEYDPNAVEAKWQKQWNKDDLYHFDPEASGPIYVLDTPPPFTSGSLHMGHILNHTWIDIAARYKRMRGYNVLLPQGFDCHGLPTELQVERLGVSKDDRTKFRDACVAWTEDSIARMKSQFKRLGYSADWSREYRTMSTDHIIKVQLSLLKFNELGLIYRRKHPVHYCWNCSTALAKAELGYVEQEGVLTYIKLDVEGEHIAIATTRPELMCACVAVMVHPDDERFRRYVGRKARLPIYGRDVPIIADEGVDMEFGTGAVYVCTYGDEQDLAWQQKHSLPVISAIDQNGTMTEAADKYKGLSIAECQARIIEDLKKLGSIIKQEPITHRVLIHAERSECQRPIELIPTPQWFIRIKDRTGDVIEAAKKMNWYPSYMLQRLIDWATSLEWDWVISRQRAFGTPIPFWYCSKCESTIAPSPNKLPVNPAIDESPVKKCPHCGSKDIVGSRDVCDCWVDSSISPLMASNWMGDDFDELYPTSLRPQGYEIIRTWLFYTIFRCLILTGEAPFEDVLINGMVQGPDGRKMSKSLGNVIEPEEIVVKYGVDPVRQWAATASLGEDYPFEWKEIVYGKRFLTKMWNIVRFSTPHYSTMISKKLSIIDQWMLSKLNRLIREVTADLDRYEFKTLQKIRDFAWKDLADNYIEMIKYRLYGDDVEAKESAQYTLSTVIDTIVLLLSPFIPHFTEEVHSCFGGGSIHLRRWPVADKTLINDEVERGGEQIKDVICAIRRYKSERGMALNAEVERIEIYASDISWLTQGINDLRGTTWARNVEVIKGEPEKRRGDVLQVGDVTIVIER
ncbi:MAG: valine--tRNA ligase [Methanocellales archaeon]|nr:valine--tRNA ligase [Methanocellales archaeon]